MGSQGINEEGIPTIDVLGHEVPLPAYWRIVDLWNQGTSTTTIINMIMTTTNSRARLTITAIVDAILDNLKLMQSVPSTGLKRSGMRRSMPTSASTSSNASTASTTSTTTSSNTLTTPKKPKPARISAYRASRLAAADELRESLAKLDLAEKEEDRLVKEALMLLAKKDQVSNSLDLGTGEKKKVESGIELDVRRTLKKHKAVEAEVEYAKALVMLGKASLA